MAIVKISVEKVTKLHHMSVLMHTIIVISSVIPVRDDLTDPVYPYAQSRADIVVHSDLMMQFVAVLSKLQISARKNIRNWFRMTPNSNPPKSLHLPILAKKMPNGVL